MSPASSTVVVWPTPLVQPSTTIRRGPLTGSRARARSRCNWSGLPGRCPPGTTTTRSRQPSGRVKWLRSARSTTRIGRSFPVSPVTVTTGRPARTSASSHTAPLPASAAGSASTSATGSASTSATGSASPSAAAPVRPRPQPPLPPRPQAPRRPRLRAPVRASTTASLRPRLRTARRPRLRAAVRPRSRPPRQPRLMRRARAGAGPREHWTPSAGSAGSAAPPDPAVSRAGWIDSARCSLCARPSFFITGEYCFTVSGEQSSHDHGRGPPRVQHRGRAGARHISHSSLRGGHGWRRIGGIRRPCGH